MLPGFPQIAASVGDAAKTGLKVLGGVTAAGALYVKLGFPVPASTEYVDTKLTTLTADVKAINADVLTTQRKVLKSDRTFLRIERMTVEAQRARAKGEDARVLTRRLEEIDDALTALGQEDDTLRLRAEKLR